MATALRPTLLEDLGLEAGLEALAEEYGRLKDARVLYRVSAPLPPLCPKSETCIFRVAQEALINVVKHAGASRITVRVSGRDGRAQLEVSDNGCGFEWDPAGGSARAGGIGVFIMQERLASCRGTLSIRRRRPRGTRVLATVPVCPLLRPDAAAG